MINLIGEVNSEMVLHFFEELDRAQGKTHQIRLCSHGGSANDAIAIAGRIKELAALGHKITVTGYGTVQSAAVLILAAGTTRQLSKGSWVMTHEDSGEFTANTSELEKLAKQARREEENWNELMGTFTGTQAETWDKLSKQEAFLTPQQALELNLIHKII